MTLTSQTILDILLSDQTISCQMQPAIVAPDEIVHVVGAQEPVRDQPDSRARGLLTMGWLKIEIVRADMSETERLSRVSKMQQKARAWLKQSTEASTPADREQVRWLIEKTRSRESKQQIAQRVWLALVLYSLNCRGIRFNLEGQILWEEGYTGRIGLSPDAVLDLAWPQPNHYIYTASFRQPDGTITRGKGRHRWYIYRLTIDSAAAPLFDRRAQKVHEKVALIVASETFATQPQLPRDFYGGDEFQQACIDAQDQQFSHILVLSPEHGVISLDDTVPSERSWDEILERRIWAWQIIAVQRLGMYLFGDPRVSVPRPQEMNWWAWLNPESVYDLTVFGGGFGVRILIDHLIRSRLREPGRWPEINLAEQRPGYDIGDFDDDFDVEMGMDAEYDDDEPDLQSLLQDIDQLLEWASEFVSLVNIFVPPTGEMWELAPDEALIPIRILADMGMDIEDLLDLLTDMSLLLEESVPVSLLINASMTVSVLLQVTHSLVHSEREAISDILDSFPEGTVRQYIEKALQETSLEDQLCACLTLAEQMQLIALAIPPSTSEQMLVWLQTHIATRMRQRILNNENGDSLPDKPIG